MAQSPTTGLIPSARELAREILVNGPVTRSALGRRLQLSPSSLTRLARMLTDAGFVVEGAEIGDRALGRPVRPLDVRLDLGVVVGVKLTGDAVTVVATDLRAKVLRQAVQPITDREPSVVVALVRRVVGEVAEGERLLAIGVGLGGVVDADGVVVRAPYLGWSGVALRDLLDVDDGTLVVIENDLLALTRAVHWFGAGRGLRDFALVTVGAGVGYGLVLDDRVVSRPDSGVGLAGHIPLDPAGPACELGHRGCSSAMLTIGGITGEVGRRLGRAVGYTEALALARDGDADAAHVVVASGAALGRLLALVANLTSVTEIVVSGEGVALLDAAGPAVRTALDRDRDPLASPVQLTVDRAGFDEWARAAAASAIQSLVLGA
ncbi:ROK family transcriptional regulator [Labedella endophytica]|uniref:ROK family transcriptional regulator n=1 Tax=Labedella endophytica TaxID=1523160 RepID=A0A3S0XD47_9MICO|nr:ROK family transcriptional regulator [Labedella endophytica]RUR03089.1 ROK family transcriptional regulator [Labedella endophytica]